ncbi:MAG: hypothetical protein AAFP10_06920 [Pseudomonadota bacterium]
MKDFIYLVQGQSDLVKNYFHLQTRKNADAIFLTYDKPVQGAVFFPDSSWAQGRNKLLDLALAKNQYTYYVFCDDDIAFIKGGFDEFETGTIKLQPSISVPVVPKTDHLQIKFLQYQSILINDEQMIAFHKDVVADRIVLPYQEQFDHIHWWSTAEIQEILIRNFYVESAVQLNNVKILNACHERYSITPGLDSFRKIVRNWLSTQFRKKYKDINSRKEIMLLQILWKSLNDRFARYFRFYPDDHLIRKNICKKLLDHDSEVFRRYLENKQQPTTQPG